ncbi:MIP/aquaporin family protein [Candidatus Nitrosotenuis aquarius]|uniref:MIP/aquaporin family protein n=1 Tax=Candidatus Nitrosotenuis aquarius TaxID=1846278 RepID=UPI0015AF0FE2|nr:aquaporin [Candidatus Nitrosotenuis aquarius]
MHKSNFVIFLAELAGTFGLLVAATGSIVYDGMMGNALGIGFIAMIHFVGLGAMIFLFGRYSMAHFNPAVTIAYFIAKYISAKQILVYVTAQAIGAFLGSLFVKYVIGDFARLGLNSPNHQYPAWGFFGVEVLATVFLMGSILIAVNIRGLQTVLISAIIAGTVALDVFFLGAVSGASMNPIRSLFPALFTGATKDLWLYWTAPFIGAAIVGIIYKKKFVK